MKLRPVVVIIDGDRGTRRLLHQVLEPHSYRILDADNAQCGLDEAVRWRPDVIILDLDLPDWDGLTLVERLRGSCRAPMLILSARDDQADKVAALDAGANAYLTKPFGPAELLARLRVLQRSVPWLTDSRFLVKGIVRMDLAAHEVRLKGRPVKLTPIEEALFYILVQFAGNVVTCRHFTRCVWGGAGENKLRDLHVYVKILRKKLETNGGGARIKTEGSTGYKLQLVNNDEDVGYSEIDRIAAL
jgi:two-component system, OmpR family, KDP operon response regulator KdpE